MKKPQFRYGLLVSVLLALPLTALFYLGDQLFGLSFVPFDLFNWVSRVLPGPVITFGIDLMIDILRLLGINVADAAKTAEQVLAITVFLVAATLVGTLFFLLTNLREHAPGKMDGLIAGALFGLPSIAISVSQSADQPLINMVWQALLFAGWGIALALSAKRLWFVIPEEPSPVEGDSQETARVERLSRRQFLVSLGVTSAAITVVGTGLAAVLASSGEQLASGDGEPDQPHSDDTAMKKQLPNQDDPVMPAPGTRPEYTPLKDHYKVFIELEPTEIDQATWVLPVTGMVSNPLSLTLDDLRDNYPSREQYVTLSCISGRIPTTLISTTQWTGVSVQDVLADARVQPEARYLQIESGDGFYETVDLELIQADERIMFCYAWDGNPLPVEHGFPLRIWIPDRFGMKQPKWITAIELTDQYREGYWVERGWDELAQVRTRSVIDTVAVDAVYDGPEGRLVPVGGIAFSGDRGISKVELRVDGGAWQEAKLRTPLSETTWVIWRFDWPYQPGDHTFEVRAYEGDGTLQITEQAKARPSGSTGIHSVEESL